jgi:hypothetical protein
MVNKELVSKLIPGFGGKEREQDEEQRRIHGGIVH